MRINRTKELTRLAVLAALATALGYFAKLPTPTGLVTLLDVVIYFVALRFGSRDGFIVGGLAGFLIDLVSGHPQWMVFSFIIHGAQGGLAGFKGKLRLVGIVAATLVMVAGYAVVSAVILQNGWGKALAEVVPNLMQNVVGLVLGYALYKLVPDWK